MNATTAKQSATIPVMHTTDTAISAGPSIQMRIDSFVKKYLGEANSDAGSQSIATAATLRSLGFKTCANSRYADFLEAFRSNPRLSSEYAEKYPACCFLPWAAFHKLRVALNLWCDLPGHYAGAVPPEQIPWMEVFELQDQHKPWFAGVAKLLQLSDSRIIPLQAFIERERSAARNMQLFVSSFFVLAPPEAFSTKKDFIARFLESFTDTKKANPPDDPLVIRFCQGGCLVVAAWGDEAAYLNRAVKELNL